MSDNIWSCKIGQGDPSVEWADAPMREAVRRAYQQATGREPDFIFSGWAAELTESEHDEVEASRATERDDKGIDE